MSKKTIVWNEALALEHEAAYLVREQEIFGVGFNIGKANYLEKSLEDLKTYMYDEIRPYLDYVIVPLETKVAKDTLKKLEEDETYLLEKGDYNFVGKLSLKNGDPNRSVVAFNLEVEGPFSRISIEDPSISSRKQVVKQLLKQGWKPKQFTEKGTPQITIKGEPVDTLEKVGPFGKALSKWYTASHRQSQIVGFIERYREDGRITPGCNPCGTNTTRAKHRGVANIPRVTSWYGPEMRSLFCVLDESLRMVGADLSGLELRCLAHRMNDPEYIELVLNGDIHEYNKEMAGLETRDQSKTFIYAFL